jgi:hypothetical protein
MSTRSPLAVLIAIVACGPKAATPEATAAPAEPEAPSVTARMPDTEAARAYAQRLLKTRIEGFEPTGDEGLTFVWDTWTFAPDGTFNAAAHLASEEEKIPCKESGTWAIDTMPSADAADIDLVVTDTSCPARDAGTKKRVQISLLPGGDVRVGHR